MQLCCLWIFMPVGPVWNAANGSVFIIWLVLIIHTSHNSWNHEQNSTDRSSSIYLTSGTWHLYIITLPKIHCSIWVGWCYPNEIHNWKCGTTTITVCHSCLCAYSSWVTVQCLLVALRNELSQQHSSLAWYMCNDEKPKKALQATQSH